MVRKRIPKRRRREGKTDYKLRMALLKSGLPRIVIRKTNKYFIIQLVESKAAQDKVIKSFNSRELIKDTKIKGSGKSIPVAYLTALSFGKTLKNQKEYANKEYILDFGLYRVLKGGRLFALAKGLKDAGLNVKVDEEMFPSEERINGTHLKPEAQKELEKIKQTIQNG